MTIDEYMRAEGFPDDGGELERLKEENEQLKIALDERRSAAEILSGLLKEALDENSQLKDEIKAFGVPTLKDKGLTPFPEDGE